MRLGPWLLYALAVALLIAAFASPRREPLRWIGCHASVLPECAGSTRQ